MNNLFIGTGIIFGGIIFGIIFEKFLFKTIKKIAKKSKWKTGEVIINSLKGKVTILITLLCIYISMPYLSIWQLNTQVINILNKILIGLILFVATIITQRFLSSMVINYFKISLPSSTSIFKNIVNITVMVLGLFVIFQTLGIKIAPLLTALGVGGLAVGLALQDTFSNFFSGLQIIAVRQIKIGDYIKIQTGEEGYVVDINWRNTTIQMLPNNLIIIPNSQIAKSIVTNYNLPNNYISVYVDIGVSYDSDLEKVEKVTLEVAREVMKEVKGGVPEFEPLLRYKEFADSSINFTVIMQSDEYINTYLIKHEFIKRIHKRYKKEKIEIPFPITTVYMHK